MTPARGWASAVARRLYGALVAVHPIAKAGYAPQMLATFEALLARAESRGVSAVIVLLARESASLVVSARAAEGTADSGAPGRRMRTMGSLRQDLRYAVRSFGRQPWLTAAIVATLALGIGANSAIFSLTKAVLFPALPLAEPSRLVMIWEDATSVGFPRNTPAPGNYSAWTTSIPALDGAAAMDQRSFNLVGDGEPEKASGAGVTPNFFQVLGVSPIIGRIWRPDEDAPGARVAVLSHGIWMRRFGADAAIVGRTISLNGRPFTVLGVMPPGFQILSPELQIWVPLGFTALQLADRSSHYLSVVGRLRAGATLEEANVQLRALAVRLQHDEPGTNRYIGMYAVALLDDYVGDTREALVALLAAAGCVLLIACANVANLLLARATGRVREMTIRAALGADRRRLITQLLTESLLLSAAGGALGLLVAVASFGTLRHLVPKPLSDLSQVSLDAGVVAVTAGVSVLTGILFGLAPAWRASRVRFAGVAGQRAVRGLAGGYARARSTFVVAEIALATVLLVCAALLVESFRAASGVDLGFRPERVLTLRTQLPRAGYAEFDKRAQFVEAVLTRVRALPGVESAGVTSAVPLVWKGGTAGFEPEGRARDRSLPYDANNRVVSPGYMETIGLTLRAGRLFDAHDAADGEPVAIVNDRMAKQYWPGEDPLGRRLRVSGPDAPWRTIVGVVGDTRVMGIDQATRAEMYFPIAQAKENWMWPRDLVVRAAGDPGALTASVAQAVWAVDRNQPVSDVATMDDIVSRELQNRRLPMLLMSGFAALALVLAAVGIYGVLAFSVAERRAEIGLRLALGGQPRGIRALFVRRGMALAGIGLGLGLAAALWGTALLQTLLFGVRARDPRTFIAQALVLAAVCFAATYVPALRASRTDPIEALRED